MHLSIGVSRRQPVQFNTVLEYSCDLHLPWFSRNFEKMKLGQFSFCLVVHVRALVCMRSAAAVFTLQLIVKIL